MARPRPSRSSLGARAVVVAALFTAIALGGCASAPVRRQVSAEAEAALARLQERQAGFSDLRTLGDLRIRRDGKTQRLSGVLLLRSPASLRFEALTSFGVPVVLVAGDAQSVTLWEVLDNRAVILPASPDSTRRWLGLALGSEDLVAILSGRIRPIKNPSSVDLLPPDLLGPSLKLANADGEQRIWLDPETGQARQVEWTGGKNPARVTYDSTPPDAPSVRADAGDPRRQARGGRPLSQPGDEHGLRPDASRPNCPGTCANPGLPLTLPSPAW